MDRSVKALVANLVLSWYPSQRGPNPESINLVFNPIPYTPDPV